MGLKVGILGKPYFRGQSIHRLDAKGRLRIPTRFREILQNHYTDALILTWLGHCLVAYPPEAWEKIEAKALELSQVQPQQRAFMRYFVSNAVECEFDKQGRILVPPVLKNRAHLEQEILLAGMLTTFEIWDKPTWDRQMDLDDEQIQQITEYVSGLGL